MKNKLPLLLSEGTPYYASNLFKAAVPVFKDRFSVVLAAPESSFLKKLSYDSGISYAPLPENLGPMQRRKGETINQRLVEIEKACRYPVQKIIFASPEFYRFYISNSTAALTYFIQLYDFYHKLIIEKEIKKFFTMGEDRVHNLLPYFILRNLGGETSLARIVPYVGITLTTDFFGPFTATGNIVATEGVDYESHVSAIRKRKFFRYANLQRTSDTEMSKEDSIFAVIRRECHLLLCEMRNPCLVHEDFRLLARLSRRILRPLREFRRRFFLKYFLYGRLTSEQDYVYFPFHVTEDAQVRLKYPEGYNQYELVRNICKNLPANYVLIVKEHPDTVGQYSLGELFALSRLPNCVLVDPKISSKDIFSYAEYIITINSTVAYEALFFGKIVFALGKTFHDGFPGVISLQKLSDLFEFLSTPDALKARQEEIRLNLKGNVVPLLQSSIQFDYQHLWGGQEMYRQVVKLMDICASNKSVTN